jgi:hypothetical protein
MTFYNKKGYFNFPIVNFPFSHKFALFSFGIPTKDEELDLPSSYWILKLHKSPYPNGVILLGAKCFSFQIINIYFISGENRASELL